MTNDDPHGAPLADVLVAYAAAMMSAQGLEHALRAAIAARHVPDHNKVLADLHARRKHGLGKLGAALPRTLLPELRRDVARAAAVRNTLAHSYLADRLPLALHDPEKLADLSAELEGYSDEFARLMGDLISALAPAVDAAGVSGLQLSAFSGAVAEAAQRDPKSFSSLGLFADAEQVVALVAAVYQDRSGE